MDVLDAFEKLREQVVLCLNPDTVLAIHGNVNVIDHHRRCGLNVINSTNLEYYSAQQKSELLRLKGLFFNSMDRKTDANQTFGHCVQICSIYYKGWLSWARYCDKSFLDSFATGSQIQLASQVLLY